MPNRVPYTKPALTYQEKIHQLKSRGLYIEDEAKALHLLQNISYYRLSGYWYPMIEHPKHEHQFKAEASFEQAFKLYCFDRELRQLVLKELEKIEVAVRAQLIYQLSIQFGAFWYQEPNLFRDRAKFEKCLDKLKLETSRSDEEFITFFKQKYNEELPPSWMILEISSFGNLSNIYSNLKKNKTKRNIAAYFRVDDGTLASWLHCFTYIRNVCAHHARFWNRQLSIQPRIPNYPKNQFLEVIYEFDSYGKRRNLNNKPYFVLSMIIYLLNIVNPGHSFLYKFNELLEKYPNVDLKAMGYPVNWENEPLWT